nr:hypothetical protein [Marihabitans asiaticum]
MAGDDLPDVVVRALGGGEVAQVLVDQYDESPATIRSCHHEVASICRRQASEVFQSSRTSWSSKIITLGSVESSQRVAGSRQARA